MESKLFLEVGAGGDCESGYSSAAVTPSETSSSADFGSLWSGVERFEEGAGAGAGAGAVGLGGMVMEPQGVVNRGEDCVFFIQLGAGGTLELTTLNCFVTGPSGCRYPVTLSPVPRLHQHRCVFRPLESGLHVGVVSFGPFHLPGSPFHTMVTRDYSSITRPLVSLDVELDSSHSTPSNSSDPIKVRKPWGITSNQNTEEVNMSFLFPNLSFQVLWMEL